MSAPELRQATEYADTTISRLLEEVESEPEWTDVRRELKHAWLEGYIAALRYVMLNRG